MDLGINMFATDYSIRPDELAREVEARGFDSLWFPEHTHIPVSRRTPFPAGGDLPKQYWHSHDPFVSLMAAAAVTTTAINAIQLQLPIAPAVPAPRVGPGYPEPCFSSISRTSVRARTQMRRVSQCATV